MEPEKSSQRYKISKAMLERIPKYYYYIKELKRRGEEYISSAEVAAALRLNAIQVRKEFAEVSSVAGKPRIGFRIDTLLKDMEVFLGYNNIDEVIIVGAGRLGQALMFYDGFQKYGFNIVAAFDNNPKLFGMTFNEKPVLDINELPQFVQQMNIKMAIIALPKQYTQEVANLLVKSGIKGILNFSQRFLEVPEDVVVQDINIVATLAILARNMKKKQEYR